MAAPSTFNPVPLDLDVMFNILVRLPAKSLLRFKCVCKEWYNLINGSPFIQHHLTQTIETGSHHHNRPFVFTCGKSLYFGDLDSSSQLVKLNLVHDNIDFIKSENVQIHIVGTCNGLVCLSIGGDKGFMICNPTTRNIKLVRCHSPVMNMNRLSQYGFGYDSQQDDYKIVLVLLNCREEKRDLWVYSLTADSWRRSSFQRRPPPEKNFYVPQCPSLFRNGMLHFIFRGVDEVSQINADVEDCLMDEDNKQLHIARFNLSSEEWEHDDDLGFPDTDPPVILRVYSTFLNGCFCLSLVTWDSISIWIMKEYGIKESWTKLFSVPGNSTLRSSLRCPPIAYSRTKPEAILFHSDEPPGLVWYDSRCQTLELYEHGISSREVIDLCVGSLVSIPGSSLMREQAEAEEDKTNKQTNVLPTMPTLEKKKKKEKRILYYSWSRTS